MLMSFKKKPKQNKKTQNLSLEMAKLTQKQGYFFFFTHFWANAGIHNITAVLCFCIFSAFNNSDFFFF